MSNDPSQKYNRIGLALSGGGFRATLFHLGVVRFLRENDMLGRVTHITSVSGGSILAAHLVLNWERYRGTNEEFELAAAELVEFTQSDLRGAVLRPWLASYATLGLLRVCRPRFFVRTNLFERAYDRLLCNGKTLGALQRDGVPNLHLLSTSLTTGDLISIGTDGICIQDERESTQIGASQLPVAFGVAASSAFPPMFAPVPATKSRLEQDAWARDHYLTDGGVFDNLGIRQLLRLNADQSVEFDLVVASRAERDIPAELGNSFPFVWGRASRSTDLMMERISLLERASIKQLGDKTNCEVMFCNLTETVESEVAGALPSETQRQVANVRTDLDSFSDDEVNGLVQHGNSVARKAGLALTDPIVDPELKEAWVPRSVDRDLDLSGAEKRKLGLFRGDIWSAILAACVLIYAAAGSFLGYQAYHSARNERLAEERAEEVRKLEQAQLKADRDAAVELNERLQEQRRQTEIVDSVELLVNGLATIALSTTNEEFIIHHEDWKEQLAGIEDDPFLGPIAQSRKTEFDDLLSTLDDVANAPDPIGEIGENRILSPGTVYVFAGVLKEELKKANESEEGFEQILRSKRKVWYELDRRTVKRIHHWIERGKTPKEIRVTRRRFLMLYWGVLGLVEGGSVAQGMVDFNNASTTWDEAPLEERQTHLPLVRSTMNHLLDVLDEEEKSSEGILD